ncbi:ribosome small subunit-dependent GTPase A [Roseicitreum antarcticum]|uniref:Small ribosomal subunit biogenesis GTPase RsgA n=1 Tax=Roseicitreum antarcticum TaxID=564137 RepID=A0A1H2VZ83_9RHOB|nr:ribosome small subunit-dependent GTPase A [Roseicitreum antarcticum]SDW73507.1 ribosome biogenesis GTPase [Roseicitreum antarcticum]
MNDAPPLCPDAAIDSLGWQPFFAAQLTADDTGMTPVRIAVVHRARLLAETGATGGGEQLRLAHLGGTSDYAVGDWVLMDPETRSAVRRLNRRTLLRRRTESAHIPQLIAANVDTLFIVTSCNDDFNVARLERYLALANEAGTNPVIVLTKVDQVADAEIFRAQAGALQRDLAVVTLNAKAPDAAKTLAPWCGPGQTVALVGSSGVGKSTLLNTLAAKAPDAQQPTGDIRAQDAKGRHTTTARSLHAIQGGGWVIDTPGMRTLHVSDVADGLDILFAEITELAPDCRFRDCTHAHEPGCAVQKAVASGRLSPDRLDRWRKLNDENVANTPVRTGARGNKSDAAKPRKR